MSEIDETREITIRGRQHIWELHVSDAYVIDALLLYADSPMVARCAAMVALYPKFAKKVGHRRNIAESGEKLCAYLTRDCGWSMADVISAGNHAFARLATLAPPNAADPEVSEAVGFTEGPAAVDMPAGS